MEKKIKIALIGYGRMGHEIEKLALSQGHRVVAIIDHEDHWQQQQHALLQADVAIEFTTPQTAAANLERCFRAGVPVVCGTTGWHNQLPQIEESCRQQQATLLHASNFSLGVNIFFALNRKLAQMISSFDEYVAGIREIHHTRKLDAPSGTAVSLANDIIDNHPGISRWALSDQAPESGLLPIEAIRLEDVPGTHTVSYQGPDDKIEITHTAHNRSGFARGALLAAQWVVGRKGVFTMQDLLKL